MRFGIYLTLFIFMAASSCIKKRAASQTSSISGSKKELSPARVPPDPRDPFRPFGLSALMKRGSDRGKVIDIDWRRSVRVVDTELARTYFSDYKPKEQMVIANVKEFDHFYVARFNRKALSKVVINKEMVFEKIPVHHIGLRFILEEGEVFELVPQRLNANTQPKTYRSLSFGIFALGVPGKYFGPANSVRGDLVSAYMFFTPPQQSFRARELPVNFAMDEILLDRITDPEAIYRLFRYVSLEGDKRGYEEIYGMFINNCVHRLLALIRGALPQYKSDGIIDRILNATYGSDLLPTGLANGFEGVIKNELIRAGAVSGKTLWQPFWAVEDLVRYVDVLNCDGYEDMKAVRIKCAEIFSKTPHVMPTHIKHQQNYLVDKCIVRNELNCSLH